MKDKNSTVFEITTETFIRAILVILAFVFFYLVRNIIAVLLFSVVLASGVELWAHWMQERKIPRLIAVILIYLITFSVFGLVFYLIVPPAFSELSDFVTNIPSYLERPFEVSFAAKFFPDLPASITNLLQNLALNVQTAINNVANGFFRAGATIFGGALSFFLIIVLSFYLSVQENGIKTFLRIITPTQHEKYILSLWERSRNKIGAWLKGQVLLGLLVGIFVFLGLTILQAKYALILALMAAVFEIIPIFGPVLAAIPAIGFALIQGPALALAVLILYIVIQQFENHLIYPLVVRKIIGVPPILVILAMIIGAQLGGFFGILLAIPTAIVLMEYVNDLEKKKEIVS